MIISRGKRENITSPDGKQEEKDEKDEMKRMRKGSRRKITPPAKASCIIIITKIIKTY